MGKGNREQECEGGRGHEGEGGEHEVQITRGKPERGNVRKQNTGTSVRWSASAKRGGC
jgi:hypothetical protein